MAGFLKRAGWIIATPLLMLGCSTEPARPPVEKPVVLKETAAASVVSKENLFLTLEQAGLHPLERPAKPLPRQAAAALPEEPLHKFMLVVDNEGWWALGFSTNTVSKRMASHFDTGFRYQNWYFAGMVSIQTTNKVKNALMERSEKSPQPH